MLIDTKQEIINSTREDLKQVQSDLNILMGTLPNRELNQLMYEAINHIQTASDALGYMGIMLRGRGEE